MSAAASIDADDQLVKTHGEVLLRIAARAIRHGLERAQPLAVSADDYPLPLRQHRATFVTLERKGELRGCVGTVVAHQPLAENVASNAHGAAFHDRRFDPIRLQLWPELDVSVSILSPLEIIAVSSEAELLCRVRPGIDGLVFSAEGRRGVFLPQVWKVLPEPPAFLAALKGKAGLDDAAWPQGIRIERFTAISIPAAPLASFG